MDASLQSPSSNTRDHLKLIGYFFFGTRGLEFVQILYFCDFLKEFYLSR